MRAHLAPGSNHRLGYNDKPTLTLESSDKPQLFRRVIILIKTARRLKGTASAKQARSARKKAQPAAQTFSNQQCQSAPKRQPSLKSRRQTPTTPPVTKM